MDSGRTVVATIHQPSAAVFDMFDDLILLKKGGNVVYFGELGDESNKMVSYFEERGATPIDRGENPAAWVLRAYAGEHSASIDWAEVYKSSDEASSIRDQIVAAKASATPENKLTFSSTYSTPIRERLRLIMRRMFTIYRRSASYNMTRLVVGILYAFLLGSIFITVYFTKDDSCGESEAAALIGTIFLSLNVIGTTAMVLAIPVAKRVRDVFYKHRASGMIDSFSMWAGMVVAELPYLFLGAIMYVLVYCATVSLCLQFTCVLYFNQCIFLIMSRFIYMYLFRLVFLRRRPTFSGLSSSSFYTRRRLRSLPSASCAWLEMKRRWGLYKVFGLALTSSMLGLLYCHKTSLVSSG